MKIYSGNTNPNDMIIKVIIYQPETVDPGVLLKYKTV